MAPPERKRTSLRAKKPATRKPVLASEVLREELAPYRPGERSGRYVLALTGLSLSALGVAIRFGHGPLTSAADASSLAFAAAGILAATALLPLPYVARAGVGVAVGLVLFALGLREEGPLAGFGASASSSLEVTGRVVALTVLPAALFFRAQYRAYRRARVALAVAVALSMPFAALSLLHLLDGVTPAVQKAGALFGVVAVLCAFLGFMGEDTTGGGALCGAVQIGVLSGDVALPDLIPVPVAGHGPLPHTTAAVGVLCAAVLVSLGLYHFLSALLAEDARRVSTPQATNPQAALEQGPIVR